MSLDCAGGGSPVSTTPGARPLASVTRCRPLAQEGNPAKAKQAQAAESSVGDPQNVAGVRRRSALAHGGVARAPGGDASVGFSAWPLRQHPEDGILAGVAA